MKKFLAEILIDPASAKSLVYDETQNILQTDDYENVYTIFGGSSCDFTGGSCTCYVLFAPKS